VLDLNGTIVQSSNRRLCYRGTTKPIPVHVRTRTKYVYLRPDAIWFLDWLTKQYDVGIWTSCIEHNAREIVEGVIPPHIRARLKFVLDRSSCIEVPGPGYRTIKDLQVVYDRYGWDPEATYAIDDTHDKFIRQPSRVISVPEYCAPRDPHGMDTNLVRLSDHLRCLELLENSGIGKGSGDQTNPTPTTQYANKVSVGPKIDLRSWNATTGRA